ncbi:MAG: hypothetical protein Q8Q63_06210 [Phaeovulum sp.]|uniref:hypothetical protein n=1 Tax=Phaeovulum sp. TaxID=2934796 RepID=UPI0027373827|nr:hypothetical protein [Phaeovulum sp.]MDP3861162.1 hypothetical protein [Phaeovulum sp.]
MGDSFLAPAIRPVATPPMTDFDILSRANDADLTPPVNLARRAPAGQRQSAGEVVKSAHDLHESREMRAARCLRRAPRGRRAPGRRFGVVFNTL